MEKPLCDFEALIIVSWVRGVVGNTVWGDQGHGGLSLCIETVGVMNLLCHQRAEEQVRSHEWGHNGCQP